MADALVHVPPKPGLYAIYGDAESWEHLMLPKRADALLYVGKSESSLAGRELGDHFALDSSKLARTGGSTVRRSFAALLRERMDLRGMPRNTANPGHFSMYGLAPDQDAALTAWMHAHLTIAVWEKGASVLPLKLTEGVIIEDWNPPLNLDGNPRPAPGLKAARAKMAAEARAWVAPAC